MQEAGTSPGFLPFQSQRRVYGASLLILVSQFPSDVRVPLQEPSEPVRYCVSVQV